MVEITEQDGKTNLIIIEETDMREVAITGAVNKEVVFGDLENL